MGFEDKEFRDMVMERVLYQSISNQIRELRSDMTQKEYAKLLGKTQSSVSRLQDPDEPMSLRSLLDIAHAHDIGISVKFVDYPDRDERLQQYNEFKPPHSYGEKP